MTLRVELLGPFRVSVRGEPLDVPAGRLRALLATLALSAGQPVSVDRLAIAVWGEDSSVDARMNLQSNVRRLRRLLGANVVATRSGGYALELDPDRVDALLFVRLVEQAAAAGDPETQRERLAAALRLWRGTPFDGVRSDWLEHTQSPWLQERYLAALERRIDLDLAGAGVSASDLAAELDDLTRRHPLREPLWVRLLQALDRSGRQAEALERYEAVRVRLADELGTDPGPELRRVQTDLLAGRPVRPPGGRATLRVVPRQLPAGTGGFTGRQTALKALDSLLADEGAPGPESTVVSVIAGPAGVGKTALAIHWAHRVTDRFPDGQLYINLRGFDPSGLPVETAEAVRGFLDTLQVPPQQIPASLDAQAGMYRSLLADRRVLVLLDNARDAGQVAPLLPGGPGCLAIVTSRNQLPGLVATGARPVVLNLLDRGEAVELLARRLGHDRVAAEPDATGELVTRCAGLPLALAIVAAQVATHPDLPLAALADQLGDGLDGLEAGDPSTSARAVFSWSYRSLDEPAARLFRLLGLHPGPDIASAAAASLAGIPVARVRPLLAELTRAHLLAEQIPGRYAFHDLLRAYASELASDHHLESDRHAATHRMLDHYLHTAHAADRQLYPHGEPNPLTPSQPGVTAERFSNQEQALRWFYAEHEVLLEVVRHAARAGFDRHTFQLAWALFVALHRRGRWHDRAAVQQLALRAARRLGGRAEQMRAHRYLAGAHADLGRFGDAHRHSGHALELAVSAGDLTAQANIHYEHNLVYVLEGRTAEALSAAQEALRLFDAAADLVGQAIALTDVGWCHGRLGDHRRALTLLRRALTLHRELGNDAYQAHTWTCLGETYGQTGDQPEAIACYEHALELFRNLGDRYGEASSQAYLAAAHEATGDMAAARDAWRHARNLLNALDPPAAEQLHRQLRHSGRPGPSPDATGPPH
jgi:DNA-binding SARP family transcriptional activator/tetratricopeptide (TPR) repeat protein